MNRNQYLQCTHCDLIVNRDDVDTRSETEKDGLDCGPYRVSVYEICPDCGEEEFNEVTICPDCWEDDVLKEVYIEGGERCAEHAAELAACGAEQEVDARIEQALLESDGDAHNVRE